MIGDYDIRQTCRTCLTNSTEHELIPLYDCAINENTDESCTIKTNGDLLMECTDVEFNTDDGLPQNVCSKCASKLRAAFAYKQMCERSDVKLRNIFQKHLNSVRVKIERIDEYNDNETHPSHEVGYFDFVKSEVFDECSRYSASENGDDWAIPMHVSDDSETNDSESDSSVQNNTTEEANSREKNKPISKSKDVTVTDVDEEVKNAKYENGRLKCEICDLSFLNSRTLKNHFLRQSHLNRLNGADVVKCSRKPVKKIKIKNSSKIDANEDAKIAERAQCVDGRFICEFCNNSFSERISLKFHIRVHLGVNLTKCSFCDRGFSRPSYLQQHIKISHSRNSPCPKCEMVFNSKEALRLHTIEAHKVPKPEKRFTCEICSRVFNRMNNLNGHRLTHSLEKNFECDICKKRYGTKRGLKDHMRTHGNRADYYQHLCPHCGRKFGTTSHMAKHIRTKHSGEKTFKCEYCDKAFYQNDSLRIHTLKHLDRFICKVCGKSLSTKFRLISHTRIHTGEKPFQCSICDEAFAQVKTLKNHLRSHGEDAPNRCDVCGEVFTHPRWLHIHRRQFEHYAPTN